MATSPPARACARSKGPSQLLAQPDDAIWEIDAAFGVPEALELLASEVGGGSVVPGVNCRGAFLPTTHVRPPLPPPEGRAGPRALLRTAHVDHHASAALRLLVPHFV